MSVSTSCFTPQTCLQEKSSFCWSVHLDIPSFWSRTFLSSQYLLLHPWKPEITGQSSTLLLTVHKHHLSEIRGGKYIEKLGLKSIASFPQCFSILLCDYKVRSLKVKFSFKMNSFLIYFPCFYFLIWQG